jgi:hypothetical protein
MQELVVQEELVVLGEQLAILEEPEEMVIMEQVQVELGEDLLDIML